MKAPFEEKAGPRKDPLSAFHRSLENYCGEVLPPGGGVVVLPGLDGVLPGFPGVVAPGLLGVVFPGFVPGLGVVPLGLVEPGPCGVVSGVLPGAGVALPAGGVALPAGGVAVPAGGVAVPLGGVAVLPGGVAVLPGGVAVPPGAVFEPGVEL